MPDQKISQLTAATTPLAGTETVPLVQGGANVKATVDNIITAANATTRTVATGGTGLTATPTNGQLLIGNGTGYTLAALTAGSGVTITNGAGTITIASSAGASLLGQTDSATPFETVLGYQAGNVNTGINNTFVGYQAGALNTTGTDNTAVGFNALDANTTGLRNTAIGRDVLGSNTANDNSGLGNNALLVNTTGSQNAAFGSRTLDANTTGTNNVAFGNDALGSNTTGSNNTVIGYQAGWNTTATTGNVLVGYRSGSSAHGNYNVGIGQSALASGVGTENVVIGYAAASDSGDKYYSVVIGSEAGYAIKPDGGTVAIGRRALYGFNSVTSSQNVAIGYSAASTLTSGTNNIVIGTSAQPSAASVSNEITLGNSSITSLRIPGLQAGKTTGDVLTFDGSKIVLQTPSGGGGSLLGDTDNATPFETSVGFNAGNANTGINNTFIGYEAGLLNSTGTNNSVLGYNALDANTTGYGNVAVGSQSLTASTTARDNTALGAYAMLSTTTGNNNVAVGNNSLRSQTNAYNNVAVGKGSGNGVTTGVENTLIGDTAGYYITTGQNNTLIGSGAGIQWSYGVNFTTGSNNIIIGRYATTTTSSANNQIVIGNENNNELYLPGLQVGKSSGNVLTFDGTKITLQPQNADISGGWVRIGEGASVADYGAIAIGQYAAGSQSPGLNSTVIGYNAQASSSGVQNEITLGNSSITALRCQVTSITSLSDARDKTDIAPLSAGLDFVNALNPVAFTWNMRDGGKVGDADTGFIAQELKAAQEETGINIPGLVYESNPERLEAAYGKLIPVLVKAIQELSAKVAELEAKVN